MTDFQIWFGTGLEHILDFQGYDHILYIIVLSILFQYQHRKQLFWMVTAFTLGHSLTLALSTMNLIKIPQATVEIWIALTIMISAIQNLIDLRKDKPALKFRYVMATVFGCIHGLGFSYLLKSMLGREESILFPLFSFNLGLELGQVLILAIVLLWNTILHFFWPKVQNIFTSTITFVILGLSFYMLVQRLIILT